MIARGVFFFFFLLNSITNIFQVLIKKKIKRIFFFFFSVFWILFSAQVVHHDYGVESLISGDNFTSTEIPEIFIDVAQRSKTMQTYDNIEGVDTNVTTIKFRTMPHQWDFKKPTLAFPNTSIDEKFRMSILLNDNKLFFNFQFLHNFLKFVQPYNLPLGK